MDKRKPIPALQLPTDRPRLAKPSPLALHRFDLDAALTAKVEKLGRDHAGTLFTALLAAFGVLMARTSGQRDFGVGNVTRREADDRVSRADALDPVVVRMDLSGSPTVAEWLGRVREQAHLADADGAAPDRPRDLGRPAPVQVLFELVAGPPGVQLLERPAEGAALAPGGFTRLDLTIRLEERGGGLAGQIAYATSRFDASTIERMAEHLRVLLVAMVADGEQRVGALPILTESELHEVLVDWNDTQLPYAQAATIHALFEEQATKTPDAVAVAMGLETLTYRELNGRANALARRLLGTGVGREKLVGLCADRTPALLVALLATLKAGAGYVPLDPRYPRDRLAFVLQDARVTLVLVDAAGEAALPGTDVPRWRVDTHADSVAVNVSGDATARTTAYVIYTSGSTGRPKGVVIEHRSAVALLAWAHATFGRATLEKVLAATSISFDLSVFELFAPLTCGGTVLLVRDALALRELAPPVDVTLLNTVPSAAAALVRAGPLPSSIRTVALAGEPLPAALVDSLYGLGTVERVFDLYGPTEDTTYSTCALRVQGAPPTIGGPISNGQAYVLDDEMAPVPIGTVGEIFLGGAGVARGYLRRPGLTAERFVPSPFGPAGSRLYRTGDLGSYRKDGSLVFLGRVDHQVKVRGFRIELGEIEAAVSCHPGVGECVVVAQDDAAGAKRLIAYVSPAGVSTADLRVTLQSALPEYMIPTAFVGLEVLPRTPNGKVDRKALPSPTALEGRAAYSPPSTPDEARLCAILEAVFGAGRVGLGDDFLSMGGHSLLAMQVVARVRELLDVELPLRALFEERSVSELAVLIASARPAPEAPSLERISGTRDMPVSLLQERIWLVEQMDPGTPAYLMTSGTRLRGPLDLASLEHALASVVVRHEALRTTFENRQGRPYQIVHDSLPPRIERYDLGHLDEPARSAAVAEHVAHEATTPFDISQGPLVRARILTASADDHVVLLTVHHLVFDGWSSGIFVREVAAFYSGSATGTSPVLPALRIQYADYAAWERTALSEDLLRRELEYWKAQLGDAPARLELPTDRPRSVHPRHRGAVASGRATANTTARLNSLARELGATPYMVLLAAFAVLVGRLAGQRDVVVATPVVNRARSEAEPIIGCFMNTLAMRIKLARSMTFDALIAQVKETALAAEANKHVPFEKIVFELNPARDASRNPIVQVCLNVLALSDMRLRLPGTVSTPIEGVVEGVDAGSKFDITLYADTTEGLRFELAYDSDLFDAERMSKMLRRFERLLDQAVAHPSSLVDRIDLTLDDERATLPDPTAPLAIRASRPVSARFAEHAAREPNRLAIADPAGSWSYGDLDAASNRVACWLLEAGVGVGDVVAILAERNARVVMALLGVLKAGAAFTLLDAEYPAGRLVEQIRIASPRAWINAADLGEPSAELVAGLGGLPRLDLVAESHALSALSAERPPVEPTSDACAYIAFTSGTTGRPKGIAAAHRPLGHFIDWQVASFNLGPMDRFSVLSGLAHDPFLRDVFTPLAIGASAHLPPAALRLEADGLASWMSENRITACHLTPSLGGVLARARGTIPGLRHAFFAGEPLEANLVRSFCRLAPGAQVVNFYGATETPQAMGYFVVDAHTMTDPAPVGRGIDGVQLLVLNDADALSAVGEGGEICVRTPYLAIGYVGEAAGGFGVNPFTNDPADRVYRTGDRGRYLADGTVVVVGRRDEQVKIRGYRVELRDIQLAVLAQGGVAQAAVVLRERGPSPVAYFAGEATVEDVTKGLRQRLPDYMIPSAIVRLQALPLTPNGKLDRSKLPAASRGRGGPSGRREEPPNEVEVAIMELWKKHFGIEKIGRHDNFFDLGGDPLGASRLAWSIQHALHFEVPASALAAAPTVAKLAQWAIGQLMKASARRT